MNKEKINYKIGKNSEENWNIYKESEKYYTIFHLYNVSSPYVITNIKMDKLEKKSK